MPDLNKNLQLSADWFKKNLGRLQDIQKGKIYNPEEAKLEFDIDLEPDWTLKVEPAGDDFSFTYITPEGWQIKPDKTYVSPEGESFTEAEIEEQQGLYKQQQEQLSLLEPFKSPEGLYDIQRAREAGISEDVITSLFGEASQIPEKSFPRLTSIDKKILFMQPFEEFLREVYPELFEVHTVQTLNRLQGSPLPAVALILEARMERDFQGFIDDLYGRVGKEIGDEFLERFGIDVGLVEAESGQNLNNILVDIYPEISEGILTITPLKQVESMIERDPEAFLEDLFERAGRDEASNVLRQLGFQEDFVLNALRHDAQNIRMLENIQAVFPEYESLDDFSKMLSENPQLFRDTLIHGDASEENKRRLLEALNFKPDEIDELIQKPAETITEQAKQSLSIAWNELTHGDLDIGEFGQVALGGLGVVGSYIEKYVGRPWESAILEARARFQKTIGWGTELDDIALQRLQEARDKYGWAGSLISEDVSDIWHNYIESSDLAKIPLKVSEWLNPAYLIPIGGTFGVAAKFTSKVPVIGRVMRVTASGVQAAERGIAYPVTAGARGVQAVGERLGKSLAERLIKQSEKLLLEIPETDRFLAGILVDNWQKKALQTAARIPAVKTGIEKTLGWRILIKNESRAVEDIVGRAGVAHAEILRMGTNAKAIKYWEMQELSRNPAKLFGFDKNGYSERLVGNLEEIFTHPERFTLDATQTAYVTRFNEVNQEVLNLLKKEGVPPEHLIDDWVHRVVLTDGQKRGIPRRIGAKPSYEKVRKFETMADGIRYFMEHPELKAHYANNPELLMADYIQATFKKIADERFVSYIAKEMEAAGKTFGIKPTEKLINYPELFEEITGQAGRELAEKAALRTEEFSASKQFKDIINRALRGETPHASTLAMLERKFPELGKRFREALGKKIELRTIRGEVEEILKGKKAAFWDSKTERAFRMSQLKQPTLKEGYMMEPFAGGKLYDREFIDAFNKFFGHEPGLPGLTLVADTAGILRVTKAALDFSFAAIQGLPSWGLAHAYMLLDPKAGTQMLGAWYKTYVESIAAFFRPEVLAKAITSERDIAMQLVKFGGSARAIDYFDILSAKKGLGGAFGKVSAKIPLSPYQRAESTFFGAGQLIRQRFGKILMPKALTQGKEFELARFLDRITGLTDSATLGVPLTTRQLEQSFAWFAPNYTRACLTVLADIFRGGMTGAMAREALGGMVAAGSAMYSAVQYSISSLDGASNEEAWRDVQEGFGFKTDPITGETTWQPSGRFMTIKVGNYYMGFGGFWYGLLRLTGNIMACVNEEGDRELIDLVKIIKNGTLNLDNPLIYWWFTRASPNTGVGYELASGKDFLGYPLETVADYARYIATRFEPIWAEQGLNWMIPGMARDNEIPEGMARQAIIPAELFGMRTFPESQWTIFYDKANEYIKHIPNDELDPKQVDAFKAGTLTWNQLTDIQKGNLLSRYSDLEELYGKAQGDSQVRGSANWKQWEGRVNEEKTTYYSRGDSLIDRLLSGNIDTREMRELWSEAGQNYGIILDAIEKEPAYSEIYGYFDDKEAKGDKYGFLDDVALQEYVNIMFADYSDEKGDIDWDAKDKAVDEFIDKFGGDTYDRIRQYYAEKKRLEGLNPLLIQMADDKDKLGRDYWQLPYKPIYEMDEEDKDENNIPSEYLALWQEYQALETDAEKEAFIEAHPEFGKDWRAEWRLNHPEEDARLALWGYSGKLQSMEAYEFAAKWAKDLGIPLEQVGLGLPPRSIAPTYFEHNRIANETSFSSIESKYFLLTDGKKYLDWALEQGIRTDDLSGESIPALKLRIDFKPQEAEYNAILAQYKDDKKKQGQETQKYLDEHPDYAEARYKVKAYNLDFPEPQVNEFAEMSMLPDWGRWKDRYRQEHPELNSLLTNPDVMGEGTELQAIVTQIPSIQYDQIYEQYFDDFKAYDDLKTDDERKNYLESNTDFAKARRERDAYGYFLDSYNMVDDYITYYSYPRKGMEQELYLKEHPKFFEVLSKIPDPDNPKFEDLKDKNVESLRISVKYGGMDEQYEAFGVKGSDLFIEDKTERARKRTWFLTQYADYRQARWQRDAYDMGLEKYVGDYTAYQEIVFNKPNSDILKKQNGTDKYYEEEWFLQSHPEFYDAVFDKLNWTDRIKFEEVPTREIFKQYIEYCQIKNNQAARDQYRLDHPELDKWGVSVGIWAMTMSDRRKREAQTSQEKFLEELEKAREEFEKASEELK